jgi:hypothetical protein
MKQRPRRSTQPLGVMKIPVLAQFLTTEFKTVPGEEDEVRSMLGYSPQGMVGKAMAEWFAATFQKNGFQVVEVGFDGATRTVILQRKPYLLWIGCLGPAPQSGLCTAFVASKRPMFARIFGRHFDETPTRRATELFRSVVLRIPGISEITWPEIPPNDA